MRDALPEFVVECVIGEASGVWERLDLFWEGVEAIGLEGIDPKWGVEGEPMFVILDNLYWTR